MQERAPFTGKQPCRVKQAIANMMAACFSRESVFRCPLAYDDAADGGAGMDMDDPVGP